jgi:molybdopterin-guanine dinucleotide biosynthesis protein A
MMADMARAILCGGKPMTVIVLAGGRGRRMNADKASLPVPGGTLLGRVVGQVLPHFDEILVSVSPGQKVDLGTAGHATIRVKSLVKAQEKRPCRRPGKGRGPEVGIVEDEQPDLGPMAGVLACLRAATHDLCAVVACDIPDVHLPFLRKLCGAAKDAEIVVPITSAGRYEPLFAVYSRRVVPRIEELLATGERSLVPLFARCRAVRIPLGERAWLRNLNTRRDYEEYLESEGARARESSRKKGSGPRPRRRAPAGPRPR